MDWKKVVAKDDRYKGFIVIDNPITFKEMFTNHDIPVVQLHSTQVIENHKISCIVGFIGAFKWVDNKITSLDYDSYSEGMKVLGYKWFKNESGNNCLDILVGDDW